MVTSCGTVIPVLPVSDPVYSLTTELDPQLWYCLETCLLSRACRGGPSLWEGRSLRPLFSVLGPQSEPWFMEEALDERSLATEFGDCLFLPRAP